MTTVAHPKVAGVYICTSVMAYRQRALIDVCPYQVNTWTEGMYGPLRHSALAVGKFRPRRKDTLNKRTTSVTILGSCVVI